MVSAWTGQRRENFFGDSRGFAAVRRKYESSIQRSAAGASEIEVIETIEGNSNFSKRNLGTRYTIENATYLDALIRSLIEGPCTKSQADLCVGFDEDG